LERLRRGEGSVLDPLEVRTLVLWLAAAGDAGRLVEALEPPPEHLGEGLREAHGLAALFRDLGRAITPAGEVEDRASPEIASARRRVRQLRAKLTERLERLLHDPAHEAHLQDDFITVRGGRYVVPVRAGARTELPGILHGTSSTGQTLFVEPMATIELNNDLVQARDAEQEAVREFLAQATRRLRAQLPQTETAIQALTELDVDFARARWGRQRRATLAETTAEPVASLVNARHPLLESSLAATDRLLVPLTLELGPQPRVLVVSGPNAGGKTVALKTVGLLCLMHQCAIPIPAERARLPVLEGVGIDIGDQQSIAQSLSTFSARMRNLVGMAMMKASPSLILLDELGAGTDPMEGGALGIAILEYFKERGALVVATTHHDLIRAHALSAPDMASAAMEFSVERLEPTYHLRMGLPGVSAGLEIAERLGLPQRIVQEARRLLGGAGRQASALVQRLRDLVAQAQDRVMELGRQREELRRADEERSRQAASLGRQLGAEYERRTQEALEEIRRLGREVIARLAERQRQGARRALDRGLARAAAAARTLKPEGPSVRGAETAGRIPFAIGARVEVRSLGQRGVLEELNPTGEASVLVGGVRLRVPQTDLAPAGEAAPKTSVGWDVSSRAAAPQELRLIGARVEEALGRLDKFLDDSVLAGHREVRVIHGSGTGRLREAVNRFLARHAQVEEHRLELERPGGEGVTLVRLRD
ncbi:MAG: Smr/MutS family protein, partial [Acidobacteriota bacterium]